MNDWFAPQISEHCRENNSGFLIILTIFELVVGFSKSFSWNTTTLLVRRNKIWGVLQYLIFGVAGSLLSGVVGTLYNNYLKKPRKKCKLILCKI